jgi:polysaccharide biosynthesis/export protein
MRLFTFILALFCLTAAAGAQPAAPEFAERNPRYRLQASDILEIQYRYTPEYNQTITVQPDGFASLQLIGATKLSGLTLDEAAAAIKAKVALQLKDPELTILVKDFVKPYFIVAGEVTRPGRFELRGQVTTIEAIALSGGFKESAKHSTVVLVRHVNSEVGETTLIDLKKMMNGKGIKEDIYLASGDMLVVPQSKLSKVERFIKWGNLGALGISVAVR